VPDLNRLSVTDREQHMMIVRRECLDFREPKRAFWLDAWRLFRQLREPGAPTRAKFISSYVWSAVQSQMGLLEPLLFTSLPTWDLTSPRDEDYERNTLLENLLTQQVHFQSNLRRQWSAILLEALVFGSSYPWTYWRTTHKKIGPVFQPVITDQGVPLRDERGEPVIRETWPEIRTHHAPWVEHVDLWDSFIHPDGRRGFSRRIVTGYELLQNAVGPNALYDPARVRRMLSAAQAAILRTKDPSRATAGGENFVFGDDNQVIEDELAKEAGTQVGERFSGFRAGLVSDALAATFPILHYDDGVHSGSYALNVDGRLLELRWNPGTGPDGSGYRMAVVPNSAPQEVYGVGFIEANYDLLLVYNRFLQLATDGASLTVNPTWLVSQRFDQVAAELLTFPGAINVVPTMSGERLEAHVQRMDMPQSWYNALQFREAIRDELDQAFASNESTFGRFASGRKTAQEVAQVLHFAQVRIQLLADRIADQFATPLGRKWLALSSVYMTPEDMENVLGLAAVGVEMPTPEEIIRTMQVIFRGSVISSNNAAKLGQIQGVAQAFLNSLAFLELPHVQEFMKEWLRLAGLEGVTKKLPAPRPGLTAFDVMAAQKGAGASPTAGGLPSTPTDLSTLFAAQGGATAPPGPPEGV
jgi:hypothetical protein